MLSNRLYRGEVAYKGQVYPGEHAAIVDAVLWDEVQQRLAANGVARRGPRGRHANLLVDLVFDEAGERLTPTHANKRGVRYRYYVSRRLVVGHRAAHPAGWRIPAQDLERLVREALLHRLGSAPALLALLRQAALLPERAPEQRQWLLGGAALAQCWPTLTPREQWQVLRQLLRRVEVGAEQVVLHLDPGGLQGSLLGTEQPVEVASVDKVEPEAEAAPAIRITVPAGLRRTGREMALVVGAQEPSAQGSPVLIRLLARAQALWQALASDPEAALDGVAEREGISRSYLTRLVRLAYLTPSIVEVILDGRQPASLTPARLMQGTRLPLDWTEQRQALAC